MAPSELRISNYNQLRFAGVRCDKERKTKNERIKEKKNKRTKEKNDHR